MPMQNTVAGREPNRSRRGSLFGVQELALPAGWKKLCMLALKHELDIYARSCVSDTTSSISLVTVISDANHNSRKTTSKNELP